MLLQHKAPPLETFVSNRLRLHHVDDTSKDIPRREHRLKIVVVGGVAGGMSFAARARRLSESITITVFEKGPLVGYASCGIPYALGVMLSSDTALILQTPETVNARYNVHVRVGSEVINIDREKKTVEYATENSDTQRTGYDKLVLAQGSEPFRPPIPGPDTPNVFNLQTISDMENIKCHLATHNSRSAAIIGGGFVGMEAAESLRASGVDVSVVEHMPHVFPSIDQDIAELLHAEIRKNGVDLYLNAKVREIRHLTESPSTSEIILESGDRVLGNIIILVVGVRPRTALAQQAGLEVNCFGVVTDSHMGITDPDIYAIGDMTCTMDRVTNAQQNLALAGPANRQGRVHHHICHIVGGSMATYCAPRDAGLRLDCARSIRVTVLFDDAAFAHRSRTGSHLGWIPHATPEIT
jgi:NADPH-dependent 2,4-dienoyl-CoA reductase/sulfur reductase-like enzyme